MKNREQFRSPFSLATAELALKDKTLRLSNRRLVGMDGGLPSKQSTPGVFLKQEEKLSHTAHSTVDKNNQESSNENSVLKNALEMLGIKNSEKILTESEVSSE
jgi:hypothetical protein